MGKSPLPYLLLTASAIVFSAWLWRWGVSLGAVGSIEEVPGIFSISNVIGSILFFGSAWWVFHKGAKQPKTTYPVLVGLIVWYGVVLIAGRLGFFAARPLFTPNIIFAFIILAILMKKALSLPSLQEVFAKTPLHWIFAVQTFRVMGVGFLTLYSMKVLPGEFAIPTGLGDVFIGVTAPLVAYLYAQGKSYSTLVAAVWNYLGIADLAMSITLGILTYPEPLRVIPTTVSNLPIALYPLVIIPVFAVPLSLLLHLFSLRALKRG